MSNTNAHVGFGTDATVLAGYAQAANERLGPFDLNFSNVGTATATIFVKEYDGVTQPSGYRPLVGPITVVAKGTKTVAMTVLSQVVGFFGSGNTVVNITPIIRDASNLRGAQIDIVAGGRKGFGFSAAANRAAFISPGWPTVINEQPPHYP